jgi:hypothetical protein
MALSALLVALVVSACGSSSGSGHGQSQSPVTTELSFFPTNSPFVFTVATSPGAGSVQAAQSLLGQFPAANLGIAALEGKLSSLGLDYDTDVKPLFGNPIALGATSSTAFDTAGAEQGFLAVWVTKSASGLKSLISKVIHGAPSAGTRDGATLYQLGQVTLAIDGATAILGTAPTVSAALDRHAQHTGFTSAELASDTAGLPQSTLMEAFGSLTDVLAQPSAAKARGVPWVAAIRGYGAAISVTSTGISLQYRLDTGGGSLTSSQVPIAPGRTAPSLAGTMPISLGMSDPAQLVKFAQQAEQASSPASWAKFEQRRAKLKRETGFDFDSFLSLLTGDLILNSDTHTTVARIGVSNGPEAASDLAKIAHAPTSLFSPRSRMQSLGSGFYAIHQRTKQITIGVSGNQLLVGKATVAQLQAFATAPTTPASFAHGSLAFQIQLVNLLHLLKHPPSPIVTTLLGQLGNITGWSAASPGALTGSTTLAIK